MPEQIIIEFIGDSSKLEEAYNKVNEQITASSTLNKESAAAFQKANADIAESFKQVTDSTKQFSDQLRDLNAIIAGGVLKNIVKDLNDVNKAQTDVASSAQNLGKQIGMLKAFSDVGHAISSGFGLASDSLALFGNKNEELEKNIVKVQAAMKVVNDLQEISNGLKEGGATRIAAVTLATKAATAAEELFGEASAAAWGAATAGITILIAGIGAIVYKLYEWLNAENKRLELTKLNNEAVKEGIELAEENDAIRKARQNEITAAQEEYIKLLHASNASIKQIRNAEDDLAADRAKNAKANLEAATNQLNTIITGQADLAGEEKYNKNLYDKITKRTKAIEEYNKAKEEGNRDITVDNPAGNPAYIEATKQMKENYENRKKIIENYKKAQDEVTASDLEKQERQAERDKEDLASSYKLATDRAKLAFELEQTNGQRKLDLQKTFIDKQTEQEVSAVRTSQRTEEQKNVEIDLLYAEANQKKRDLQRAFDLQMIDDEKATIDARLALDEDGYHKYQELQDKIAEAANKRDTVTKDPQNKGKQGYAKRLQAENEYTATVNKLNNDFTTARLDEQDKRNVAENNAEIEHYDIMRSREDKYQRADIALFDKIQDDEKKNYDIKYNREVADLNKNIAEQEKSKKKYLADGNTEAANAAQKEIDGANQSLKTLSEERSNFYDKETKSRQEYIATGLKQQAAANKAAQDQLTKNHDAQEELKKQFHLSDEQIDKMFEDERTANPNETDEQVYTAIGAKLKQQATSAQQKIKLNADTDQQIATASVNFAKQAADQIFATENANRNQRYNDEIAMLQKQSAFELQNNNLTQAQKIAIQRKFDKQEAAVKLQQWKADQKAKEEQAAINGALAITTLIASSPMVLGVAPNPAFFIGLASTIATTATNIAAIAAQKPPAFAKGTPHGTPDTPAGLKLVGEHGPEFIYTRGAERIITAPDTAAILAKYDVPAMPNVPLALAMRANANTTHPLLNEDTLAKKIALEISKQTRPLLHFDKNGFTAHLITRGSKTTIMNNKYKI